MKNKTRRKTFLYSTLAIFAPIAILGPISKTSDLARSFLAALFCSIVLGILIYFCYVLYCYLSKRPSVDGAHELSIYQTNRFLPAKVFEANVNWKDKLKGNIPFFFMCAIVCWISPIVLFFMLLAMGLLFFLPMMLIFGTKFISYIEFNERGLCFYTRLHKILGLSHRFFIPYEKCRVSFMNFAFRGNFGASIMFSKNKFLYVQIPKGDWERQWESIIEELNKRLPQSHFA